MVTMIRLVVEIQLKVVHGKNEMYEYEFLELKTLKGICCVA